MKKIGIWMDHSSARLMEFNTGRMDTVIIHSQLNDQEKEKEPAKSDDLVHRKEPHEQFHYYKEIGEAIKEYGIILLFGPTAAKNELHNLLKNEHRFAVAKFEVRPAEKMTEYQQYTFVREYFADHE